MDGGKETPITKYLANLEKRKSLFSGSLPVGSSSSSPPRVFPSGSSNRRSVLPGVHMRINFDDTFFSRDENESILHISPQESRTAVAIKRRRTSILFDEDENVDALHKKVAELERLLRQTQSELIDGRASYSKLDQINIDLRRVHNEKLLQLEKSEDELKLKCKNSVERTESMEKQLLKLQRKDSETGRDFQNQVTNQLHKIASLEDTVVALQKEKRDLAHKFSSDSIRHEELLKNVQLQCENSEKQSLKSEQEALVAQSKLSEAQLQLQKSQDELSRAEAEILKYEETKKMYEILQNTQESSTTEVCSFKEQLRKYENRFIIEQAAAYETGKALEKLKEENQLLRSTVQREFLLEEQLFSAESDISVLKSQLRDKATIEGERNNLRNELSTWISVATKLDTSCRTPIGFEKVFHKNQELLLTLKLENSNLKHSIDNKSRLMSSMETGAVKLNDQIKILTNEKEKLSFELKKTLKRMTLIIQDRDALRDLKDSYEKEFDGIISEPLKTRISQLESTVAGYEELISERPSPKKPCEDCNRHISSFQTLQVEVEKLKGEKEKLSQTLVELNQSVTEDPTTGLKIVSFGKNPSLLSLEARLKECVTENESLKAKLRKYDEDTLLAVPDEKLIKAKKELEGELKTLERKHEILKESYDYETVQLQNACTKLFGYYVTLNRSATENSNEFRIQSIYSSSPDEMFILQEGQQGEMLLLDTPILAHFQDDIERFLRQESSIPAFLSAVTITFSQGIQLPSSTQNSIAPAVDGSMSQDEEETIQLRVHAPTVPRREVQIEVEGEDEDDEDEEHYDGEGIIFNENEEESEEEEGLDMVHDYIDDEAEPEDDDDDIVVLD